MKLAVVILAAGQGKRMKSALPKVLQPLAGRPLLRHVLERARRLQPDSVHVVYGHGGEQVRAAIGDADLKWALQAEQLGTGHALMQAMPDVGDDAMVLVLASDAPAIAGSRPPREPIASYVAALREGLSSSATRVDADAVVVTTMAR